MSEEIQNAATTVPVCMVWSLFINGLIGLAMYIAILFCAGNLQAALNTKYVYPFIEVILQAIRSRAGSATILAVLIVLDLGLIIGVLAAASRLLWSFARDRGVPYWAFITRVILLTAKREQLRLMALRLVVRLNYP